MQYKLYSNIIPCKGSKRSILIDIQREKIHFIPNDLYDILIDNPIIDFNILIEFFGSENKIYIDEYFDFLNRNELLFCVNAKEGNRFNQIEKDFYFSNEISNVIVDINDVINFDFELYFENIRVINVKNVNFRLYCLANLVDLNKIIDLSSKIDLESIEILVSFNEKISVEQYINILKDNYIIQKLIIFNSPINEVTVYNQNQSGIIFTKNLINNEKCCGVVSKNYFTLTQNHYLESINHNTCLNRKISIDVNGEIKNCPSLKESYGNIKEVTLLNALNKKGFKKFWNISKDKIKVCQDCEFRNICTDCRAYVEDPEDIYSKPLKCGYNPYTNEWESWSKNPLKQIGIEYYEMRELNND